MVVSNGAITVSTIFQQAYYYDEDCIALMIMIFSSLDPMSTIRGIEVAWYAMLCHMIEWMGYFEVARCFVMSYWEPLGPLKGARRGRGASEALLEHWSSDESSSPYGAPDGPLSQWGLGLGRIESMGPRSLGRLLGGLIKGLPLGTHSPPQMYPQ